MCSDFGTEYDYSSGYPASTVGTVVKEELEGWEKDTVSPSELAGKMDQELDLRQVVQDKERFINALQEALDRDLDVFDKLQDEITELAFKNAILEMRTNSGTYKHSRIRIQLSRPLTYAEREKLTTDHHTVGARLNVARNTVNGFLFKLRVSPNGTHVWVDADTPSRLLYEVVAAALDAHFVNVYPTAVRTFTEYHA